MNDYYAANSGPPAAMTGCGVLVAIAIAAVSFLMLACCGLALLRSPTPKAAREQELAGMSGENQGIGTGSVPKDLGKQHNAREKEPTQEKDTVQHKEATQKEEDTAKQQEREAALEMDREAAQQKEKEAAKRKALAAEKAKRDAEQKEADSRLRIAKIQVGSAKDDFANNRAAVA
jgi:outer membrane biosynthesis protein TonB